MHNPILLNENLPDKTLKEVKTMTESLYYKIEYRIITHPKRLNQAIDLALKLPKGCVKVYVDEQEQGAKWNHFRALQDPPQSPTTTHIIVLEDDALPVPNFDKKALKWVINRPDDFISLYLGTGRPKLWQQKVDYILSTMKNVHHMSFISLTALIHAVAYIVPVNQLQRFKQVPETSQADFALGQAWGKPIVYPVWSLVDHEDAEPVQFDVRERLPRKARFLNDK